jgi:hypothetical protein
MGECPLRLILNGKCGFGTGPHRVAYAIPHFWRWFGEEDVELVVLVHLEHLGCEPHAHGIGLADQFVHLDLHESLL